MKLVQGRIAGGVWEGIVQADTAPVVQALHEGRAIEGVGVRPVAGKTD